MQLVAELLRRVLRLGLLAATTTDVEVLNAVGEIVAVSPSWEDNVGDTGPVSVLVDDA